MAMDPIQYKFPKFATSVHSEEELRFLIRRLGDRDTIATTTMGIKDEDHEAEVLVGENRYVLEAPTSISLSTLIRYYMFEASFFLVNKTIK